MEIIIDKIADYTVMMAPTSGGYDVRVPAMQTCNTHGKSLEEAIQKARMSIVFYLEALEELGLPQPEVK